MEPLNLRLPEPDFDEHFPECLTVTEDGVCICDELEVDMRDAFAEMRADLERGN